MNDLLINLNTLIFSIILIIITTVFNNYVQKKSNIRDIRKEIAVNSIIIMSDVLSHHYNYEYKMKKELRKELVEKLNTFLSDEQRYISAINLYDENMNNQISITHRAISMWGQIVLYFSKNVADKYKDFILNPTIELNNTIVFLLRDEMKKEDKIRSFHLY